MFQTTLLFLTWYSLTTTLFQAVESDVFLSDCKSFIHDAALFIQTFIGWTIDAGQSVAQVSTKIPNTFIAGIIYCLLLILIVGICVAETGHFVSLLPVIGGWGGVLPPHFRQKKAGDLFQIFLLGVPLYGRRVFSCVL